MKRKFAKLCLDCDEIYSIHHRYCPDCASEKTWMLGNWLQPVNSATIIVDKHFIERKNDGKDCDDGGPPINPLLANSHSLEHYPTSNDSSG